MRNLIYTVKTAKKNIECNTLFETINALDDIIKDMPFGEEKIIIGKRKK